MSRRQSGQVSGAPGSHGHQEPEERREPTESLECVSNLRQVSQRPYSAFQKSRHAGLLKARESRGPTCVTCHGEAAAQLLSPDAIAGECNQCHGPGKRAPHPERAIEVRQWLERVREVRAQLDAARPVIDAIADTRRQQQLRNAYRQAEAPLVQSVIDGHAFVFADSNERLDVARQRTAALRQSIIGAPSR